jgi:hypothetical protein
VRCATRYNVSVFSAGNDDVSIVDGAATSYTVTGTDPARTYRIQVSSRDDSGQGAATTVYYLRPAVIAVKALKVTYADVSTATLTWTVAAGSQPKGYHLLVTRLADQKAITDVDLDGAVR